MHLFALVSTLTLAPFQPLCIVKSSSSVDSGIGGRRDWVSRRQSVPPFLLLEAPRAYVHLNYLAYSTKLFPHLFVETGE